MNTYTRKIGLNRGKKRLWLEGKILLENGFPHGQSYELLHGTEGFIIHAIAEGKRKVAGTKERPVIDIMNQDYLMVLSDIVNIEATNGRLSIALKVD